MAFDSDVLLCARTLFEHRFEEEIRPAYNSRLLETKTKFTIGPQLLFSGMDAQRLIAVEVLFAREAATAQADCLVAAIRTAGLKFDNEALIIGLNNTKELLNKHKHSATNTVFSAFGQQIDQAAKAGIEQDIDAKLARIHDSVLSLLKSKLAEAILLAKAEVSNSGDKAFARLAIDEARKSVAEDGRPHPKVGAVVVKDGVVLCKAHRGEILKSHAEYIALDEKLSDDVVAGTTVYTTLEPCTTRKHPKIPCAQRLIDRRVACVVIGMLDPNPEISGKGWQLLREAGIEIRVFDHDLMQLCEEMNSGFIRSQKGRQASAKTDEDQSSWPDVILECEWPSFVHEPRIPGSHTVRNRPWMLRYRSPGAVYNVRIHRIDFGAYKAMFPFPVKILTDTASVCPIICRKVDGKPDEAVMTTHDLESLIRNPPSGCDVQQYAVEVDTAEGEDEGLIHEVEIPVWISYDDKNGNQFRIKYLLHYEACIEKGEMIRIGRIEKVAPK